MSFKFEQFTVGDAISFDKTFWPKDFEKFAELSGDLNPLHHDPDYAAMYANNQLIVPLHLIIGPLSRIAGMNFPGVPSLYLNHRVRAVSQLKYGEEITYSAKIAALHPGKRVMTIEVVGFVGDKVIFDAEMNTRALRSEWDQDIASKFSKAVSKKRVLITGSSGAIASAIARKFAYEGWPTLLQSRSKLEINESLLGEEKDVSVEFIEADLSIEKDLDSLVEKIELLGDIGFVIHTASPPLSSGMTKLAEINYSALKRVTKASLPQMLRRQHGKILTIGSTAMLSMIDGLEDYAIAKSMAASYLKWVDSRFSAYGINGFVLAPDFVATEYSKAIRGGMPSLLPSEVASKVYDILTSDSSFMTVQYVGSSEAGTYGFMPNNLEDTDGSSVVVASNQKEEISYSRHGANEERLLGCIKLILLNASSEAIRNGGLGLTSGWDSLAQIQIMLEVERHFNLKFSSGDFENLKTYRGILTALRARTEDRV